MARTHLPLKAYQQRSLDALKAYLERTQEIGAAAAFDELSATRQPYIEVPKLPQVPYVCLRVPTGGGKTLMASHAVVLAAQTGAGIVPPFDFPMVLWLVPSRTILDQTLAALRDASHPYRAVLVEHFGAALVVHDLAGAQQLNRGDAIGATVIIVTTMQGLRVEDREARKIYEQNGALMSHFSGIDDVQRGRQEIDATTGLPPASLCNLLRMHRPLVIVDEAHNSRTSLSFETLARFNPSAIVEFTATPNQTTHTSKGKFASNVLRATSAAELKSASMIKLPIRLWAQGDPVSALGAAVGMQKTLEDRAKEDERATGEYLRPLVLIQAQDKRGDWTVDAVKLGLMEQFEIPEEQIVIATGQTRGLEGIDLKSPDCPVRYIITIEALREGWDCSFAYVLCSLANSTSETAVEQILGRVLRLPGAKSKRDDMLNCAYAYVASTRFHETARHLADALIENGFQGYEARRNVISEVASSLPLFENRVVEVPLMQPPQLNRIADEGLRSRVEYNADAETLIVRGGIDHKQLEQLKHVCANPIDGFTLELEVKKADGMYLNKQTAGNVLLQVPWLAIRSGKQLDLFEEWVFLALAWNLAECDPALSEGEFPSTAPEGYYADIDLDPRNQRVVIREGEEASGQLLLGAGMRTWDMHRLVGWLDREIEHPDITMPQSIGFLRKAVEHLLESRGIQMAQLVRERFRLKRALESKIAWHRKHQRQQAYQAVLFGSSASDVVVEPHFVFTFEEDRYAPTWYYEGPQQWKRHQFQGVGELKDGGEEFQVAVSLDRSPNVQVWVRNVPRTPGSFWLQTSTDKFYPDFVAQLVDGRVLVVEYKGEHLRTADDAKEKALLGELWAEKSDGKCIFWMPSSTAEFHGLLSALVVDMHQLAQTQRG